MTGSRVHKTWYLIGKLRGGKKRETRGQTFCATPGSCQRSDRAQQAPSPLELLMDHHILLLAQLPPVPGHNCPFFIFPQGSCCDLHESFPDTGLKNSLSSEPLHFPGTVCCSSTWKGRIRTTGVAAFGIYTVPNLISNGTPEGLLGSSFPEPILTFQCSTAPSREPQGQG